MRILIACEMSGIVREAFRAKGHDAYSCDLEPSEQPSPYHIQADCMTVLCDGWDMMIAHPPCTYLSYAGERWFKVQPDRHAKRLAALVFFMRLLYTPFIPIVCIENPRGYPLKIARSTQVIHPYHFGDGATKETHLWLRGLPPP